MRKHLTLSNIIFTIFLILMIIPQTRVAIQSRLLRLFLTSPDRVEAPVTVNADRIMLSDLDGKMEIVEMAGNKPKVINLWATWCGPCVAELPSLQKLYESYGDRVEFVLIANEESDKLKQFLTANGYTIPVYRQLEALPEALESSSIPATFVVDKSGRVQVSERRAKNWNSESVHQILDDLIVSEL